MTVGGDLKLDAAARLCEVAADAKRVLRGADIQDTAVVRDVAVDGAIAAEETLLADYDARCVHRRGPSENDRACTGVIDAVAANAEKAAGIERRMVFECDNPDGGGS